MTDLTIKIDSAASEDIPEPAPIETTIKAKIRRTLDGDLVDFEFYSFLGFLLHVPIRFH